MLVIFLVTLILLVQVRLWMVKGLVDKAISEGHNVTLGVHGPGRKSDYYSLLRYAKKNPNKVALSVKLGHMSPREIAWLSKQPGVRFVWHAAKWSKDRWVELCNVIKARNRGGNVGLTIAAYNGDSEKLLKASLKHRIPVRLVKGYYRSDIKGGKKIDQRFFQLLKILGDDFRVTGTPHALATHDPKVIAKKPSGMRLCQYMQRKTRSLKADLYVSVGWTGLTTLHEIWFVGKPRGLVSV